MSTRTDQTLPSRLRWVPDTIEFAEEQMDKCNFVAKLAGGVAVGFFIVCLLACLRHDPSGFLLNVGLTFGAFGAVPFAGLSFYYGVSYLEYQKFLKLLKKEPNETLEAYMARLETITSVINQNLAELGPIKEDLFNASKAYSLYLKMQVE